MRASFVVEFTGPSGAGKSTLAAEVRKQLDDQGVSYRWHDSTYQYRTLRSVWKHRRLAAWRAANIIARRRPPVHVMWPQMKKVAGGAELLRRLGQQPGLHLVDEGLFLPLPNHIGHQPRTARGLLSAAPRPQLLVNVTATPEVTAARREQRGSKAKGTARTEREHRCHSYGVLVLSGQIPIFEVDATEAPTPVTARSVIAAILQRSASTA